VGWNYVHIPGRLRFRLLRLVRDTAAIADPLVLSRMQSVSLNPRGGDRIQAVDTFRGFTVCMMVFVSYGGGGYWYGVLECVWFRSLCLAQPRMCTMRIVVQVFQLFVLEWRYIRGPCISVV
jgi:hypothetical protein